MCVNYILDIISNNNGSFIERCQQLVQYINAYPNFCEILHIINTIPESIPHDSTEEKLWAKAADIALSSAFTRLGLKSAVLDTRGDSADVIAKSVYHDYSLVADAKAFRLSRTAKNQKDFKVVSLSNWKQDSNYAVLCSPYFHYPVIKSQIYQQSIEHNVCLLSWEHIIFMLNNNVKETQYLSLNNIWNFSRIYGNKILFSCIKNCFLPQFNKFLCNSFNIIYELFDMFLANQINLLKNRGNYEISYWKSEMAAISNYSKEQAIRELIKSKKIYEKINQISIFISGLNNEV